MDTQALTQALRQFAATQEVLTLLATWLSVLVVVLVLVTLVGFVALLLELRTMRHMLVAIQASAERIAEMVRDVQRRVP